MQRSTLKEKRIGSMTQKVLLTLQGMQFDQSGENADQIGATADGDYYKKNDKHYVLYEEVTEGFDQPTRNRLKFSEDMVELSRSGSVNVHMVFRENKKNLTNYNTPFGQILMGIDTKTIRVTEREERITVEVHYVLEINDEFLSDCHMKIDICAKSG